MKDIIEKCIDFENLIVTALGRQARKNPQSGGNLFEIKILPLEN
jgi:hypothetical protein